MKAIVVKENGGPENLGLTEVDAPNPGAGQVAVAVETAGVNYLDVYQRAGSAPAPFVAGVEGVGTVTAVGEDVDPAQVGRRVGWLAGQGSYAETVVIDATKVVDIPVDVSTDDAVALLMQGVTAHYLATSAYEISSGTVVLVHSAAGGVGRLLVQVAHHLGATVIGTASTEEKRRIALDAGADHAIAYEGFADAVDDLTEGRGADVVYDGVGRDTVVDGLESLGLRGRLVVIGSASGAPPAIGIGTLAVKSLSIIRPSVAHFTARPGELRERAEQVFDWAREGVVTTSIAGRYPLAEAAHAQRDLTSRTLSGKLLIDVASTG